jgi:hypothetical protein
LPINEKLSALLYGQTALGETFFTASNYNHNERISFALHPLSVKQKIKQTLCALSASVVK